MWAKVPSIERSRTEAASRVSRIARGRSRSRRVPPGPKGLVILGLPEGEGLEGYLRVLDDPCSGPRRLSACGRARMPRQSRSRVL
jgi:hypothetical protein